MQAPQILLAAAQAAADVAGAAIRPLFRAGTSRHLDTTLKADHSPVTIADRTAERAMRAVLEERLPQHGIAGEELATNARMRDFSGSWTPLTAHARSSPATPFLARIVVPCSPASESSTR